MSGEHQKKRTSLKSAFRTDGKSCRELISDRERLDRIEAEIRRGEALIEEAETLRKQGIAIKSTAEAKKQKELVIQAAIAEFKSSNPEFIEENGVNANVIRVREGEISGKVFVVITGERSAKQFQVFFKI